MMDTSRMHWPSILLTTVFAMGVLLLLVSAIATGMISIAGLFDELADPAGSMIQSFASGFEVIVLLICGWFVLQKTLQKETADLSLAFPFSAWQLLVIPAIFFFSISLGAAVALSEIKWLGWLILPALTLLAVVLPILLFLGVGTNGIEFGPRWRTWSALGLSMTVAPLLMISLEIIVVMLFVIAGIIFLSTQPQLTQELSKIGGLLNQGVSDEAALELLAPYFAKPAAITSLFLFLSLIVPLIEELFKPLAVWLLATRVKSPASGFALGILSGGAFALVESLSVSGDGSAAWFVIVGVRTGTSLLHMTTTGLMGFAIVQLFHEKKWARFIVTYLTAAALHGIWNACAVITVMAILGQYVGKPEWLLAIPGAFCGFAILAVGMFAVLIAANRNVRSLLPSLPAPARGLNEEGVK